MTSIKYENDIFLADLPHVDNHIICIHYCQHQADKIKICYGKFMNCWRKLKLVAIDFRFEIVKPQANSNNCFIIISELLAKQLVICLPFWLYLMISVCKNSMQICIIYLATHNMPEVISFIFDLENMIWKYRQCASYYYLQNLRPKENESKGVWWYWLPLCFKVFQKLFHVNMFMLMKRHI